MLRCYTAGATELPVRPSTSRFPTGASRLVGWLRKPQGIARPPVAVILPGPRCLQGRAARLGRGVHRSRHGGADARRAGAGRNVVPSADHATNGGRCSARSSTCWSKRGDVNGHSVGVVGQSLGAIYAPLAAAGEPRLKACIANCGPYDWGTVLPKMPQVSQEVFRVRSHAKTMEEAHRARARRSRSTARRSRSAVRCW